MDQATLWISGIAVLVHVLLASVAVAFLYKDREKSVRTKIVHGLLAWLVPFIGCVFSINSFFGVSGSKSHHTSSSYDTHSDNTYTNCGGGYSDGCDGGE